MHCLKFTKEANIEIEVEEIGRKLAISNSELQAEFFNSLARGFEGFGRGDSDGLQMLWIGDNLTPQAEQFITKFAEYIHQNSEENK